MGEIRKIRWFENLHCALAHIHQMQQRLIWALIKANFTKAHMNPTKLIGILLVVGGLLGLLYGGFSYTKESTGLKLGPIELKVQEKQRVNIPLIVSAGGLALGIFLLAVGRK